MSKLSISPTGAFSCEWNKGIDRKASCPVKLVISMHAFLRALFFNYTVRISEVYDSFLENNSNHYNSLFGKEYRKKLMAIRSCLQLGELDLDVSIRSCLQLREVDVSQEDRKTLEDLSKEKRKTLESAFLKDVDVEQAIQAIKDGDFFKADSYLAGKSIGLIKPNDFDRLFMIAYESLHHNDTVSNNIGKKVYVMKKLLDTKHCDEELVNPLEELVNSLLDKKENPMSFFLDHAYESGVMYIIRHSATALHLTGKGGCTPLMLFSASKNTENMEILIEKGEDINACDDKSMTALHYAASNNNLNAIALLLNKKYGIIADARNNEGMTALHLSVSVKNYDPVSVSVKNDDKMHKNNGECSTLLVLKGNFYINAKDNNKRTPLHIACMEIGACNDLIDSLLGLSNISLNEKDCDDCTPLHYAVASCIESTPLHCAVDAYKTHIILALLDAGADRKAKNTKGKTPLMIAKERQNKMMVDLLTNYKKPNNKNSHSSGKGSSGSDANTDAESKKRKRKDVK